MMEEKILEVLHEQYENLKTSIKSDKIGSETEPLWDHTSAKTLLSEMTGTISRCLESTDRSGKAYHRLLAMKGALHYQHAKVLVQLRQMDMARDILKTCVDFLKDSFLAPEVTFLGLRVLNHYCYLLTKCGDLDKSQELLELAESKYMTLKERSDIGSLPLYSNDDLFQGKWDLTPNKEVNEKLEKLVTNNLQMLGYVYNKKGDLDRFALYHHRVLRRQLDMREGDATVWAMKTARLGYFFLTRNKFHHARHHLAAACYVLSQYENTLKTLDTTELVLSKWDELNHRYADIAKCWVRYGLFLFNASKMKLVSAFYGDSSPFLDNNWGNPFDNFPFGCHGVEENEDTSVWTGSVSKVREEVLRNSLGTTNLKNLGEEGATEAESPPKKENASSETSDVFDVIFENSSPSNVSIGGVFGAELNRSGSRETATKPEAEEGKKVHQQGSEEFDFRFPNLDLNCFENCVSCNYVDGLQSARALFLFTHSWLKKSKLFYTLKDHPMEYVNVILDLSELYRYLAFYEDDIENQYSVQKRRADTLETLSVVLKEVRPQCYIAISIELFRELAEIHLELMGLNLRRLYFAQPEAPKEEESKGEGQCYSNVSDFAFHKIEAVADVHRRLYQFSEILGHGALGDFESACAMSPVESDIREEPNFTVFDSCQQVINMETVRNCYSKFVECKRLLEVEAKKDPETEPYRSKYKAKDLLLESKALLSEDLKKLGASDSELHVFKVALAAVLGQLGVVCMEIEELARAEEFLSEGLESVADDLHPDFVTVAVQVRNQLGFLWSNRSQLNEAKKWLEEAEQIYKDFRSEPRRVAKRFIDFFDGGESDEGEKELEAAHTLTKFYLAQVYGALKDLMKSAIYCHETLRRELVQNEYDPIDWALNAATLSQFFMERILFKQARHHLAASSYVLENYEETLKDMQGTEEEVQAKKEEIRHRSADVARCWAKYGIFLLEHSKNRLLHPTEEGPPSEKNEDLEKLWFDSLDLSFYEKQIADSEVVAFEDARELFLVTQKHLNKAKEYYTLEDRASDHVQIVQDHSQLLRHLTAFEADEERQFKMMKKRVDMLESVLKELNPKYYLDVCRQLWFELGETYHDMMQVKFQKAKDSNEAPVPQTLKKINGLAENSVANFNYFLDSVKDKETKELPDPIPETLLEPTLVAHFYLGRLYHKYITPDRRKQLENTTKAYECFKFLVNNCEKNEKAKNIVGEELSISKEMMTLLQMKALQL